MEAGDGGRACFVKGLVNTEEFDFILRTVQSHRKLLSWSVVWSISVLEILFAKSAGRKSTYDLLQ